MQKYQLNQAKSKPNKSFFNIFRHTDLEVSRTNPTVTCCWCSAWHPEVRKGHFSDRLRLTCQPLVWAAAEHTRAKTKSSSFSAQRWKFVPDQLKTWVKTNANVSMLSKSMVPRSLPSVSLLKNILSFSSSLNLQQHLLSSLLVYKAPSSSALPASPSTGATCLGYFPASFCANAGMQCPPTRLSTDGQPQGLLPKDTQSSLRASTKPWWRATKQLHSLRIWKV